LVLGVAFTVPGLVVGTPLAELEEAGAATVGEPDDRTLGEFGAAVATADVAGVDGHREPW
jgi:hypothetical protein